MATAEATRKTARQDMGGPGLGVGEERREGGEVAQGAKTHRLIDEARKGFALTRCVYEPVRLCVCYGWNAALTGNAELT